MKPAHHIATLATAIAAAASIRPPTPTPVSPIAEIETLDLSDPTPGEPIKEVQVEGPVEITPVTTIKRWLETAERMERAKVLCQVMAGLDLMSIHKNAGIKRGNNQNRKSQLETTFDQIVEQVGLTRPTAYRLIEMAKAAKPRLEKFHELKGLDLGSVPLDSLSAPQSAALEEATRKLTDGMSQQEFFRKMYKGGGAKKGGARDSEKEEPPTAEEAAAMAKAAALNDWSEITAQTHYYGTAFTLLEDSLVEAQIAELTNLIDARRQWLSKPIKARNPAEIQSALNTVS